MLNPKYCRSVVSSKMLFSLSSPPDKWASVPVLSGHRRPIRERLPNAVEKWSHKTLCWRYTFILARTIPPETQACWEPMQDSLFLLNSLTFYAPSEIRQKSFHMKISFVCIYMKINFHKKNFALNLAFIMRFTATRKWPIAIKGIHL